MKGFEEKAEPVNNFHTYDMEFDNDIDSFVEAPKALTRYIFLSMNINPVHYQELRNESYIRSVMMDK